jgi:hypothetical protein
MVPGVAVGLIYWRLPTWYLDLATRSGTSVTRLVIVSILWLVLFSQVYACFLACHPKNDESPCARQMKALSFAALSFVELQPDAFCSGIHERVLKQETGNKCAIKSQSNDGPIEESSVPQTENASSEHKCSSEYQRDTYEGRINRSSDWLEKHVYRRFSESVLVKSLPNYCEYVFFFQLVIACVHLGLLVSVLYRRITRHAP